MSRLTELEKWPEREELIFPCDCHDADYLRITWDPDPEWRFLWIEAWSHTPGFFARIKGAWRILTGRSWQHSEIILNEETVEQLAQFLTAKAAPVPTTVKVDGGSISTPDAFDIHWTINEYIGRSIGGLS